MSNERRLGRGLEALLGPSVSEAHASHGQDVSQPDIVRPEVGGGESLIQVRVNDIDTNPYQPRTVFDPDEIASLSESLGDHGLLQPIVVRRSGGRYELISGERRWRAAIAAGWTEVPATVRQANDRQVAEMTIVENVQRKDLSALEKAASFQQYLDRFACKPDELARRLSIDRSTVANLIRLLELPGPVQQSIREGKITAGHGRALLPLGEEAEQVAFAKRINSQQLSVRATEQLVSEAISQADADPLRVVGSSKSQASSNPRRQHLATLEQELRAALGSRVDIQQSSKGRGKVTIHFNSREEFDRLRAQLTHRDDPKSRAG